jgi:hypothetical protein
LCFSDQTAVCTSHFLHACHESHQSPPLFNHPNKMIWKVQILKFLIM